jgi:5-methylthioadenosine/S-adenosylhomocysteine deaminase
VGTLAPGKRADIIDLDLDHAATMPRAEDPVATIVQFATPDQVRWVFVDGQVRKRDGQLVGVDLGRLSALAQDSCAYLLKA